MTPKQHAEHDRLRSLWVTGMANRKQILRCMDLDRMVRDVAQARSCVRDARSCVRRINAFKRVNAHWARNMADRGYLEWEHDERVRLIRKARSLLAH